MATARWNAEILMRFSTVYPFRLPSVLMQCVYCETNFKEGVEFRNHMENEHIHYIRQKALAHVSNENWLKLDCTVIKCRICKKSFSKVQEVAHHLKDEHRAKLRLGGSLDILPYIYDSQKIQCGICFINQQSLRHLSRHLTTHFNKFTCESCGKTYINLTNMRRHSIFCNTGKHYCRKCKLGFDSLAERNEHVEQNQRCWQYRCDHCDIRLRNWSSKQHHETEVHKVPRRTYSCPECKDIFSEKVRFRLHFRTMHKRDALFCPYCNKSFDSKTKFNDHVVSHTKEKSYVCTVCDKAFGAKKYLMQHSWIHNEMKRFECTLCDRKFNQRVSWKSHMKSRHPELS